MGLATYSSVEITFNLTILNPKIWGAKIQLVKTDEKSQLQHNLTRNALLKSACYTRGAIGVGRLPSVEERVLLAESKENLFICFGESERDGKWDSARTDREKVKGGGFVCRVSEGVGHTWRQLLENPYETREKEPPRRESNPSLPAACTCRLAKCKPAIFRRRKRNSCRFSSETPRASIVGQGQEARKCVKSPPRLSQSGFESGFAICASKNPGIDTNNVLEWFRPDRDLRSDLTGRFTRRSEHIGVWGVVMGVDKHDMSIFMNRNCPKAV
jgi:hypothetical protein